MIKFRISGRNMQERATDGSIKGFWHKPLFTLIFASFLIPLNLFLFLPSVLYQGNTEEFSVPFQTIFSFFLAPAAGLIILFVAIGLLLPETKQRRYISVLFITGLLIFLQGNLLVWKYGLLDGQGIDWTISIWRGYIDSLLWILLLALAYYFYRQISKIVAPVTIVIVFLQFLLIGFSIVQQPENFKGKGNVSPTLRPPLELFQFSSKQNVIHILMDGFQSDIFQEIIEEDPDFYYEKLQGFTFFKETTGSFPTTKMSLPAIFSGKVYRNDVPMPSFLDTLKEGNTISNALSDKGYDIHLALTIYDVYTPGKQSLKYYIPVPYNVTKRDYELASSALMLDLVLFRCVPHFVKKYVYNDQKWLIQSFFLTRLGGLFLSHKDRWGVSTFRYFSHEAFVEDMINNMSASKDNPVYKFIHLAATHAPYILNRDCKFAGYVLPSTRENNKIQCKCSLNHFTEFLNKLKAMNIYDSSLIILSADTGVGLDVRLKNRDNRIKGDEIDIMEDFVTIVGSALPLMAIKPPNEKGPLKVSKAQTMLTDIPATVNAILNFDVEFPGIDAFELDPAQLRERRFYYYKWRHENWQDDYFDRMDEFIIRGSVFDRASWRKGSTFSPQKNFRIDDILHQEGFRNSMKVSKNYQNIVVKTGKIFSIPVLLENTSRQKWIIRGNNEIRLSYHWLKKSGEVVIHDGIRSSLPHNLNPGDKAEISAEVKAPGAVGEYILEFDMVQEHVAWFGWRGSKTLRLDVVVK